MTCRVDCHMMTQFCVGVTWWSSCEWGSHMTYSHVWETVQNTEQTRVPGKHSQWEGVASFPDLLCLQFLIACSMQKQRKKAGCWEEAWRHDSCAADHVMKFPRKVTVELTKHCKWQVIPQEQNMPIVTAHDFFWIMTDLRHAMYLCVHSVCLTSHAYNNWTAYIQSRSQSPSLGMKVVYQVPLSCLLRSSSLSKLHWMVA